MAFSFGDLSAVTLVAAALIALCAGFVKGAVGFAMPLILISGLSAIMDPRLAVAALILPTVASNLLQMARAGRREALDALRDFWVFTATAAVMVLLVTQLVPSISPEVFYFAIGVPVLALSAVQLLGVRFSLPVSARPVMDPVLGFVTGTIGGLAGNWGPTTVLYLLALGTERQRQLAIQGVVYTIGSLSLMAGHLQSGLLNMQTAPFSAALLIPAGLGMMLGFRFGDRLDKEWSRKVTLFVLVIAALNLIRRGVTG